MSWPYRTLLVFSCVVLIAAAGFVGAIVIHSTPGLCPTAPSPLGGTTCAHHGVAITAWTVWGAGVGFVVGVLTSLVVDRRVIRRAHRPRSN